MMAKGHTVTGAALAVGIFAHTPISAGVAPQTWSALTLGAVTILTAGCALLPDIDHPGATVSKALPPVSTILSRVAHTLSGGHRKGTHTAWFVVLSFLVTFAVLGAATWAPVVVARVVMGLLGTFFAALALVGLGVKKTWLRIGGAVALGVLVALPPLTPMWFALAVALGVAAHILGDMLTTAKVPIFYPLSDHRFGLAILGNAGSGRENALSVILWLYIVTAFALELFGVR